MVQSKNKTATVLYVDDLQTNLVLFEATFANDFNIILAESARKALEIMKEHEIQVLVTDQRMPDMTGTELLQEVAEKYPETRRFLLTAYTDFETVVEAVNKGHIHGYINKPLQVDEIRLTINNSLEVYYLRQKNNQILEELEKANAELLNLDELKTGLIKVISHEIRDPLNRIMGTLHMLKDKIESSDLIQVINVLDNSVSKLEDFSSMAEQISILKSPDHKLKEEEVKINQLIEYGLMEARGEMQEKSLKLDLQNKAAKSTVRGDMQLLVGCLANLVKNGIDHTHNGETLTIRTTQNKEEIRCEIIDGGSEYSDSLLEQLEGQFTDRGNKLNLNLGIELGLAQMIMEAHGGRIVFSRTGDNGATFSMVFNNTDPSRQESQHHE